MFSRVEWPLPADRRGVQTAVTKHFSETKVQREHEGGVLADTRLPLSSVPGQQVRLLGGKAWKYHTFTCSTAVYLGTVRRKRVWLATPPSM